MTQAVPGSFDISSAQVYLHTLRDRLPMFVITDHPTDWPEFYVARLHLTLPKDELMPLAFMDHNLERLQTTLEALGLVKLMRSPEDDPVILETWL
jgi:hypothetical protein